MRSILGLTGLIAPLLIGVALLSWTGCSCEESGEAEGPVVVVPEKAPEPAPAPAPAAQPEEQKKRSSYHPFSAPAEYTHAAVSARGYARNTALKAYLENELKQFRALKGRFPKDLKELEEWRGEPLQEPGRGNAYKYDPTAGTIDVVESQ